MKIVVSGGTGFIGKPLCRSLSASGHDVILLTRQSNVQLTSTGTHVRVVHWDGMTRGPWEYALNGADAVINLAGKPIADRRWTVASKKSIVQSRIGATRLLVEACASLPNVPPVLVSGSAIVPVWQSNMAHRSLRPSWLQRQAGAWRSSLLPSGEWRSPRSSCFSPSSAELSH